jgi:catechol 2,3-dioxygenase-like lactoylglutathione lyase family enzyme
LGFRQAERRSVVTESAGATLTGIRTTECIADNPNARETIVIDVRRLGHASLATPDLAAQVDYWTGVMGLQVIDRGKDRVLLATRYGQEAIALEAGPESLLSRLSFEVAPGTDLAALASWLKEQGIASSMQTDITPGIRNAVVFRDPKDTIIEVFERPYFHPASTCETGVDVLKLGHVAYRVPNLKEIADFYCDVLGFRVSDWIGDHFAFLRCGVDHHTINLARYNTPALHHVAFEVKDWAEIQRSCELFRKNEYQLVWGPLRHIVGHNIAAYHRNPDDVRIEVFCEMDLMKDESLGYWEPRPWHEEFPLRPKTWPADTWRSSWGFGSFGTFPGYP